MRTYRRRNPPEIRNNNPCVRRFFEEMHRQQMTATDLARRAGVNRNTVTDWRTRTMPTINDFMACLDVLNLDLRVVARQGSKALHG